MIKVSVIVPIYNVEKYIKKCLDSLYNQTLKEIQIILVNDGSTDNSNIIAQEYAQKYKNKTIYLEEENRGLSAARNYGMKYATGEYITFLDSDDYIEKDTYEKMYKKATEEKADVVECDFVREYPDYTKKDTGFKYNNKNDMVAHLRTNVWNKLIKKELILKNKIEFPIGLIYEDLEFTCKLIPYIKKISYINEIGVHYIKREDSISKIKNEKILDIYQVLNNIIKFYTTIGVFEEYKTGIEYRYIKITLCDSMTRISRIEEKEKRNKFFDMNWNKLNQNFPNWHDNEILKNIGIKKKIYMRTVNKFTYYKIYKNLFILKEKKRAKEIW